MHAKAAVSPKEKKMGKPIKIPKKKTAIAERINIDATPWRKTPSIERGWI